MNLGEKTVIAIDPGSSKCGLALVHRNHEGELELLWRKIVPTGDLGPALEEAKAVREFGMVIIGSGTKSKDVIETLREKLPSIGILVVDERDTSMMARERYWIHNPRRGWRRLLPSTLQLPPEPVDDFVALILAEKVLAD